MLALARESAMDFLAGVARLVALVGVAVGFVSSSARSQQVDESFFPLEGGRQWIYYPKGLRDDLKKVSAWWEITVQSRQEQVALVRYQVNGAPPVGIMWGPIDVS